MKTPSGSESPGSHLVAGILVFGIMTVILGLISENVITHRPLTVADVHLNDWFQLHRSQTLTRIMLAATSLGATRSVVLIAGLFLIYLFSRRRYYWLVAVLLSVFGGMLLNRILKFAFQRPRPYFTDPILSLTGYSFPSGHTMAATVLFGVAAAYLFVATENWRRRILIIVSAAFLIGLVGFSRMYLGAHYLSDVLAAMAEGLAYLSLCLTVVYSVWRRRQRSSETETS